MNSLELKELLWDKIHDLTKEDQKTLREITYGELDWEKSSREWARLGFVYDCYCLRQSLEELN